MKLFKVVFETEVMILAEDENEAIANAGYYVQEESPVFQYSEPVDTMNDLNKSPEWKGCIPYSARRGYNTTEKRCQDFVVENYGGNTPIVPDETMEELLRNGVKK
jgi:hypothetical protein